MYIYIYIYVYSHHIFPLARQEPLPTEWGSCQCRGVLAGGWMRKKQAIPTIFC